MKSIESNHDSTIVVGSVFASFSFFYASKSLEKHNIGASESVSYSYFIFNLKSANFQLMPKTSGIDASSLNP